MLRLSLAMVALGSCAWAQQVISAHSGAIHKVEGQVTLDGKLVQPKFAEFPDVKNGQILASQDGRAEVLLTPGDILRISDNSSFKMISNDRADTRIEVLTGSAIVEAAGLLPGNSITLLYENTQVALLKKGLYRIDADPIDANPGKLRIYDGEARVTSASQTIVAKKGRAVNFGPVLEASNFDLKDTDEFYRWASRRSEYLSQATVSSARSAGGYGYLGGGGLGQWAWNPWYGMFTYLPYGSGMYYSPFGWPYYNPVTVVYVTAPRFTGGGVGYGGNGSRIAGSSTGYGSSSNSGYNSGINPHGVFTGSTGSGTPISNGGGISSGGGFSGGMNTGIGASSGGYSGGGGHGIGASAGGGGVRGH